jgi:transposase
MYSDDYMETYRLTNERFWRFKLDLGKLIEYYKEKYSVKSVRDWKGYETEYRDRLNTAANEIRPIIKAAAAPLIKNTNHIGRPWKISVENKVMMLLLKDIFDTSNRKTARLLPLFGKLRGISTTYKTVERLYSNPLVSLVLHNMFVIMIRKKGIKHADISGDGTGYSLTIKKHYSSNVKKHNGKVKSFAYAFAFIDLKTKMYVGYGTGMRSETEAFNSAREMMASLGIDVDSVRLDRYYTYQSIVKKFDLDAKFYILPKKNTTVNGSSKWHEIWRDLMWDTMVFLKEYYRRESSESSFASDKRSNGWQVWQRHSDRIATAVMCKGVWHNLLLLGGG